MTEMVFLKNRQALTTSLKVAEVFEKRHDNVIQTIEREYGDLLEFKEMFRKATYPDSYGRKQPMYYMNRDGFFMLVTGFTGKKATAVKLAFIKAFNAMEQILLNQQNEQWREIRAAGKVSNRELCDVIHDVIIPLAREQGATAPDRVFYINYQRAINKAAGIKPNSRDELPVTQLYEIEKLQRIAEVSIKGLAARDGNYKQIYRNTNQTLENYSRLSLITERFLLA